MVTCIFRFCQTFHRLNNWVKNIKDAVCKNWPLKAQILWTSLVIFQKCSQRFLQIAPLIGSEKLQPSSCAVCQYTQLRLSIKCRGVMDLAVTFWLFWDYPCRPPGELQCSWLCLKQTHIFHWSVLSGLSHHCICGKSSIKPLVGFRRSCM